MIGLFDGDIRDILDLLHMVQTSDRLALQLLLHPSHYCVNTAVSSWLWFTTCQWITEHGWEFGPETELNEPLISLYVYMTH